MFAERASAELAQLREVQALPSNEKGLAPEALMARYRAKKAADEAIPLLEDLLFPEDE